jgi:lipopolysaccharide biosynthesis glycosyltransferase
MQLATAVASLVEHLPVDPSPTTVSILELDTEPATRARVERAVRRYARSDVRLDWHALTGSGIADVRTSGHLSAVTFARLLLPELLPAETETVVYLDSDLIVCDDLSELCDLGLGELPVAAVQDYAVETIGSRL